MARLSKEPHSVRSTRESCKSAATDIIDKLEGAETVDIGFDTVNDGGVADQLQGGAERAEMEEVQRRESAFTRTSVSSLPESNFDLDDKSYTPPLIRPSFMRPESVRRMQMSSPTLGRSPRQSVLRYNRSQAGTPRSVRSIQARGSPRPRKRTSLATDTGVDGDRFPLVLLHVTLLPIRFPCSEEALRELLPEETLDALYLVRSKVDATVAHRGLLLSHPHDDYELLEERLLEALELREPRVTTCGHFQPNHAASDSRSSIASASDSGVGSSIDGSTVEESVCPTCHHGVRSVQNSGRFDAFSIKVYAANGLMRASAWAAAWTEMESVDVELLPWIDDEMRKKMVRRGEQEVLEQWQAEQERLREEGEILLQPRFENAASGDDRANFQDEKSIQHTLDSVVERLSSRDLPDALAAKPERDDLPQVYRPSQIPLSVLLHNYLALLLQDRRKVATIFVAIVALWLAFSRPLILGKAPTSTSADAGDLLPKMDIASASSAIQAATDATVLFGRQTVENQMPYGMTEAGVQDGSGSPDIREHAGHYRGDEPSLSIGEGADGVSTSARETT